MPTIYLPKKEREKRKKHSDKSNSLIHQYVYNTDKWRKLRIQKLVNNPTCECLECKKNGIIKLALDVHHIIPISQAGDNIKYIQVLGFDYENLMAVSPECHRRIHYELNNGIF